MASNIAEKSTILPAILLDNQHYCHQYCWIINNIASNIVGNISGNIAGNISGNIADNIVSNIAGYIVSNIADYSAILPAILNEVLPLYITECRHEHLAGVWQATRLGSHVGKKPSTC